MGNDPLKGDRVSDGLVLNLTGADTSAGEFEAMKPGTYEAVVFEADMVEVEGESGKLPKGTPGINVQFMVTQEPYINRRAFNRYWLAPDTAEKADKIKGIFVNFLSALGYDKDEVMSGNFNLDLEDLVGKECRITVGRKERIRDGEGTGIFDNNVLSVKPAGVGAETTASLL